MARGATKLSNLDKLLRSLGEEHGTAVSLPVVGAVIERVLRSQRRKHVAETRKIRQELKGLIQIIETTKSELAELDPKEIKVQHIAPAADELDAIVKATEGATNTILDMCEDIERRCEACAKDSSLAGGGIMEPVTAIYEACTFQDITGQRISKVVGALRQIEERIESLSVSMDDGETPKTSKPKAVGGGKKTLTDQDLLNGPQLQAAKQDEIDALFDSL